MVRKINIRVITKAKNAKVDLPKVYTTVAPTDGHANEAVIKLLSEYFNIAKSKIKIVRGEKSRDKVIDIDE